VLWVQGVVLAGFGVAAIVVDSCPAHRPRPLGSQKVSMIRPVKLPVMQLATPPGWYSVAPASVLLLVIKLACLLCFIMWCWANRRFDSLQQMLVSAHPNTSIFSVCMSADAACQSSQLFLLIPLMFWKYNRIDSCFLDLVSISLLGWLLSLSVITLCCWADMGLGV
jgi:hypothetical protein